MVFPVRDPARLRRRVEWLPRLPDCARLAAVLLLSGCGPSFEVLAEGDLRFVHCDRLDLDTKIAPSHRLHCWREWRRMYTYGQTRDRVEYAQRRIAEVVSGDTESPFLLPDDDGITPRHRVRRGLEVQATSPAPVRPVLAGAPAALAAAVPPGPDELACRSRCEASNAECAPGCETRPTGCKRCEQPLEACLAECKPATPSSAPRAAPSEPGP